MDYALILLFIQIFLVKDILSSKNFSPFLEHSMKSINNNQTYQLDDICNIKKKPSLILLVNFTENFSLSFWFRFTQLKDKIQDASFVGVNYKNLFCSLHVKTLMIQNQSFFKEISLSIDQYQYENISIEKTNNLLKKTVLYEEVKNNFFYLPN